MLCGLQPVFSKFLEFRDLGGLSVINNFMNPLKIPRVVLRLKEKDYFCSGNRVLYNDKQKFITN